MDEELRTRLRNIDTTLNDIRANTRTTFRELLLAGLLRGAGFIIGSALTIVLAGWGLAIFGVIPGADEMADYLSQVIEEVGNAQ